MLNFDNSFVGPTVGKMGLNGESWTYKKYLDSAYINCMGKDRYLASNGDERGFWIEFRDLDPIDRLFRQGLWGQAYELSAKPQDIPNKLYALVEGVCLETDVLYDTDLLRIKGTGFGKHYVGGPFLEQFDFSELLSDKLIARHNSGKIKPGDLVENGLVIFDGERRFRVQKRFLKDEGIEVPKWYWENPEPMTLDDVSYSPYQLRISSKEDADFVRGLAYGAVKSHLIYNARKNSDYRRRLLKNLKPHYVKDVDGCFATYDIEKTRKIRQEIEDQTR